MTQRYIYLLGLALMGCNTDVKVDEVMPSRPPLHPDYIDVTMPVNMAPPTFTLKDCDPHTDIRAIFQNQNGKYVVKGRDNIAISMSEWHKLATAGDTVQITVQARDNGRWIEYQPFWIAISEDEIDSYLAYRLIEPGYETWNEMGIYQRNLENYDQSAIITNKATNYGCMNCHSFCDHQPDRWLMHMRVDLAGTYVIKDGEVEKLNTKTPETISALVYPQWHPSGKYVAFSVNDTKQMFHTSDPNRIEVYDNASDVVVYDVEKHKLLISPFLKSDSFFATFPSFSPDGKKLYFCSAEPQDMPDDYDKVKYSLCSIGFDPETGSFGAVVDTLYNAGTQGRSVSFPRVSPDGQQLMLTLHDYGNFSIWHREADLYMIDLESGEMRPLDTLNSEETESYHTWSSNGRWVVFSSRRMDGLYTRPFVAHIDENGVASKAFAVPQADAHYYDRLMKSYNVPELVNGEIKTYQSQILEAARTKGTDVGL